MDSIVQQVQQLNLSSKKKEDSGVNFVYIPQDESKPLANLLLPADFTAAHPGDALPEYIKPFFADSKRIDSQLLQEQTAKLKGSHHPALQGGVVDPNTISAAALQSVTSQGSVETFCLVHPADTNDHRGVYLFLDEVGLLKRLPPNMRATQLAVQCGYHPPPKFYGDMFVGRVQTKPTMTNVSFTTEDAVTSAVWMQRAVAENVAWQQAMGEATGKASQVQGTEGQEVTTDAYAWTQTDDELELRVKSSDASANFEKNQLKVRFQRNFVLVEYQGSTLLRLELYGRLDTEGSTWTLDDGGTTLVVTCEKEAEALWPRLLLSES